MQLMTNLLIKVNIQDFSDKLPQVQVHELSNWIGTPEVLRGAL